MRCFFMENVQQSMNKTRSIRATDEVFARFKAITETAGGTNEGLNALLNAYELQQAKQVLTGQVALIDDFTARADGIVKAYISALELSANAEERIKNEYEMLLKSYQKTIAKLQTENESIKAESVTLQTVANDTIRQLKADITAIQATLSTAKANEQRAIEGKAQAEQIATLTASKLEELKATVDDLTERAGQSDTYKAMTKELQTKLDMVSQEKEKIIAEYNLKLQTMTAEQQTRIQMAVNQTTAIYQQKIAELQQQHSVQLANIIAQVQTKAEVVE